jgi:hypothetical protein
MERVDTTDQESSRHRDENARENPAPASNIAFPLHLVNLRFSRLHSWPIGLIAELTVTMAAECIPIPANGLRRVAIFLVVVSALWAAPVSAALGEPAPSSYDPRAVEFFENRIRPILAERCYKCHSTTSEKVRGGLLLDSRDGVRNGGDNGAVVVPGDPEHSPLIRAVRYSDKDLQMPPKEKLPAEAVAALAGYRLVIFRFEGLGVRGCEAAGGPQRFPGPLDGDAH